MGNRATVKLIQSYLSALDTPRALAIWIMFSNNEHEAILRLEIDPLSYEDPLKFRLDYLATKFLSKSEFLSTKIDKKKTAIDGFLKAEVSCKAVNRDNFRTRSKQLKEFEWIHSVATRKIERILGSFCGDEVVDCANWGPGVTLNRKVKRDTSSTNKFRFENGITRDLHDFISGLHAAAYPTWKIDNFEYHIGNKIVTVPKNSKTDRTIAIEPGLNLWYQKAVGTMIRRRLNRFGLDLNSQERNQKLALLSSKNGRLATIDFSNASDSISIATVEALLPPRWFSFMSLLRSGYGSIDSSVLKYEKFSSMGNGFTFELESLIFYSIALGVCNVLGLPIEDVSVYGDDVIIPVEAVDLFVKASEIYGFTVNVQKSYSSGHFRESCGSHYFNGLDCKPYFLRKVITGDRSIYLAANTIRRVSRLPSMEACDSRFEKCWKLLYRMVAKPCKISEGYGDGGFIVNLDEAAPPQAKHGIEGYHAVAWVDVPLRYYSDDHALLLARLKGGSAEMSHGNETNLRSRVKQVRKRLLIRRWTNLGPWF